MGDLFALLLERRCALLLRRQVSFRPVITELRRLWSLSKTPEKTSVRCATLNSFVSPLAYSASLASACAIEDTTVGQR